MPHFGRDATLEQVIYFSAFEMHKKPATVIRHKTYIEALKATGAIPKVARFKWKPRYCHGCRRGYDGYEEKETDVAVAVMLLELFADDACDIVVLVTGDTDFLPAIRTVHRMHKHKQVWVAPP